MAWTDKFEKRTADGFRSRSESRVASLLREAAIAYDYESEVLEYTVTHKYYPDFIVPLQTGKKVYLEVKGWFQPKDRSKALVVRRDNPEKLVVFVFDNPNAKLNKTSKTTYAAWCEKNQFLYTTREQVVEFVQQLMET